MTKQEAINEIESDLKRKDYSPRTAKIYSDWIGKLADFYPKKEIDKLGFKEINEYLTHLNERLCVAPSSINQAFQSYNYLFNKIWNRNLDLTKISKPERERSNPDILTPQEILDIIENTNNLQHKLLISIAYSAGLELYETKNLRVNDVDTHRDIIKIRDPKGKAKREAVLAKFVKRLYKQQLKENKPKTYLFESTQTGNRYGDTTVRKILVNQAIKNGITKKVTFKTLKYSYILHLRELGRPLLHSLNELGMSSSFSLQFFSEIANRNIADKPFSPLDKIALHTEIEHPVNREYFEQIISGISDKDEADYLKEALTCMTAGSLRAGIIFAWNAAILNLRKKCFNHGKTTLNNAIKKQDPKAKDIKKEDDFAYVKDSYLLRVAQDLGEIDKGEKDALEDCLDLRNKCGYPGNYKPKTLKASSFMEEIINIVFKK